MADEIAFDKSKTSWIDISASVMVGISDESDLPWIPTSLKSLFLPTEFVRSMKGMKNLREGMRKVMDEAMSSSCLVFSSSKVSLRKRKMSFGLGQHKVLFGASVDLSFAREKGLDFIQREQDGFMRDLSSRLSSRFGCVESSDIGRDSVCHAVASLVERRLLSEGRVAICHRSGRNI